ncbi:MAG: 7-cyano-7-deazaguanine synthase QueC [Gammaproteobacteria bacterium]|nr:7-cyano-7-deazaguanine synthase QueC [Gammaproteobacteria bacterium]
MQKAVILLSGGLDSATVLAIAKTEGFALYALSFRYGQRSEVEVQAARRVAEHLGAARHLIVDIDLRLFGGSALTSELAVPKNRSAEQIGHGVPITYVPARNTIFLSYALAWAESLKAADIFIGVNAIDYSGYPDCRPEYIAAYERMANLATKAAAVDGQKVHIHAPLNYLNKTQIIQKGLALGVDYALTVSCYEASPAGKACGECDSCLLRQKAFAELNLADPAA